MFTGIIECLGKVIDIKKVGTNLDLIIESAIGDELKVDQSVAHNGICLTVTKIEGKKHYTTAIEETVEKTTIGEWTIGQKINIERASQSHSRLDGHIVQGHVDAKAIVTNIEEKNGSWIYTFQYKKEKSNVVVDKGSVCINGVSLTVINPIDDSFSVAIIPFTYEHTTFHILKVDDSVNIEFDIIGKYIYQYIQVYKGEM
jgi:riboflavin synthase